MKNLSEMKARLVEASNEAAELSRNEGSETRVDELLAECEKLQADIGRQERIEALAKPAPRPVAKSAPVATVKTGEVDLDGFVKAVATGNVQEIRAAATTFGNEGTSGDGGYLAPTEYSRNLEVLLKGPQSILGICDSITTTANSIVLPVDADAPWTAAGIQPGDVDEGAAYTQYKPVFTNLTITLHKKGVLVPVSEELLTDGVNVGGYVAQKSAEKLLWQMNKAAMTAFLAAGGKVEVAKTGGAAAGSAPDIDNVLAMFESVPAELRDGAVWFANPRLQKALMKLVLGQVPVFVPGMSLANAPHDTILGHRVIWSNLCAAQGTAGDLVFVAPKSFYAVTKGGPKTAISEHLYFDQDIYAYKTNVRMAVASKFGAKITAPDTTEYGNVAVLATRS